MTKWLNRGILASLVVCVVCGCGPLTSISSLIAPEPSKPPELHALKIKNRNEPIKVAVLVYNTNGIEVREEFRHADKVLAELLVKDLKGLADFNGDKIEMLNTRKVASYTSSHPHWQEDLVQVGKDLNVDFVIYLEMNKMSMYDKGSGRALYKGHAEIAVSLYRTDDVDGIPEQKVYYGDYPKDREVPVDTETPEHKFNEQFLNYVAKHVSWFFMAHPKSATYMDDED